MGCLYKAIGSFTFFHSSNSITQNNYHNLVDNFDQGLDELRKLAEAYYLAGPDSVRNSAEEFFSEMDDDGDGYISRNEFQEFMRQIGDTKMTSSPVFWQLSSRGDEKLDFMDIMTLYYVMKSGRPFCDGTHCGGDLMRGAYFACRQCFYSSKSFCLCPECFMNKKHTHDPSHQFLDNFTLLEVKRQEAVLREAEASNQQASSVNIGIYERQENDNEQIAGSSSSASNPALPPSSLALVPIARRNKWKVAFRAFNSAVNYGFLASEVCNIL
ncbi:uncharacterized protein LOC111307151 [Durio zibethinus]|uniref:Uncharacterized protein LOC111307151 n=1 Tax=Durio zibethinus TaxID=66656 RepID=A0A6P6A820_DURZI|nr:uncharacterized protein LOC111307151 [Durio zibethinus]